MKKLIATDIDGTLIKESSPNVEDLIPETLHKLIKKGNICVVASGRQYHSIRNVFRIIKDEIVYIAENGALIRYQGKDLYVKAMSRKNVVGIIEDYRKYKDTCEIIVSTPDGSYLETENQEFIDLIHYGYHNKFQVVKDILAEDITVIKIAIYCKESIRELGKNILIPKWESSVKVCIAGEKWVDFMDAAVDKGHALQYLQKYFGVSKSETIAFGDNANDIGMLQAAGESYVVANAQAEVKKWAKHICPPYWEKGVYQVLKEMI